MSPSPADDAAESLSKKVKRDDLAHSSLGASVQHAVVGWKFPLIRSMEHDEKEQSATESLKSSNEELSCREKKRAASSPSPDDIAAESPLKKVTRGNGPARSSLGAYIHALVDWMFPIVPTEEHEERKRIAVEFVKSVMKDYEIITNVDCKDDRKSAGMSVLRDVVKLETGKRRDVVIRSITEPFWQSCIDTVDTNDGDSNYRVCAIGTPGIGKTSSTSILIRMLLKAKKTVVYLIRSDEKVKWYYEFKYDKQRETYATEVYPEYIQYFNIRSLRDPSTYYVVDPGNTISNCNPETDFQPKVILVTSPDKRHWGGSQFYNERDGVAGSNQYFPLWTLNEVLTAQPILGRTDDEIEQRYRQFGGVPRHIFATDKNFDTAVRSQDQALNEVTVDQAIKMAKGKMDAVETMSSGQPKSALIGYQQFNSDGTSLKSSHVLFDERTKEVVVISALVREKIYTKFMKNIWQEMIRLDKEGWKVFEAYGRELLTGKQPLKLRGRICAVKRGRTKYRIDDLTLGGCEAIRLVHDIVENATEVPNVLFHSMNPKYPLIDFIYKDKKGKFHAFQVTIGETHRSSPAQIKQLEQKIGGKNLNLYYLVPSQKFKSFATNPVNPKRRGKTFL